MDALNLNDIKEVVHAEVAPLAVDIGHVKEGVADVKAALREVYTKEAVDLKLADAKRDAADARAVAEEAKKVAGGLVEKTVSRLLLGLSAVWAALNIVHLLFR